ncbi:MAG: M48 family metalloprotease [Acidobacteria bacterium]|nr:M48 family metalloprotease [Acidobacteriota bacterium]
MKRALKSNSFSALVLAGACLLAALPLAAQFPKIPGGDKAKKVADTQKEWTADEEKQIGEATAAKMIAVFGLYEEPRAVKYVNLVGEGLAQFAPRQTLDYRFAILDTDIVNAFATPGGYIFITRGLLANLENEAELAGILGHEIIHTSERHLEKELRGRKLGAVAVEEGTSRIPVAELAKLADQMADTLLAGKLSRDKENEADSKGLELVAAVGYDTTAFPEFLQWLGEASNRAENRQGLGVLAASHPSFSDRVKSLNELISKRNWNKEERPRLPERYQENVVFAVPETPAAPGTMPESEPPKR